jgi:hypothetical protein
MFNLGFIAVGRGANRFLDWWAEHLVRDCLVSPESDRFVDQRWLLARQANCSIPGVAAPDAA